MKKILVLTLCTTAFIACKKETTITEENTTNITAIEEVVKKEGYVIGDEATDFTLMGTDDKTHSLAQYTNAKGFIVIFTCNHFPYAIAYEDRIIALDKKYKDLGYPVIAINPNDSSVQPEDSFDLMKVRAKEKGFTFPYLVDEGQKIYPQYGATKTPHVFLFFRKKTTKT